MSPSTKMDGHHPDDVSPHLAIAASRHPELPELDLDDLSPLPPAQGVLNSRPVPTGRLSILKRDVVSRAELPYADAASPALSAAPSSFRLEGSPPNSPQLGDSTGAPLAPKGSVNVNGSNVVDNQHRPPSPAQSQRDESERKVKLRLQTDELQQELPFNGAPTPSAARYVTVSAILSRSEMYYAPEASEHWSILRPSSETSTGAEQSHNAYSWPSSSLKLSGSIGRKKSQRKRPSNGSAIEALGALLLRKDSSGRVASLSFAQDRDESSDSDSDDRHRHRHAKNLRSAENRSRSASEHGVRAWTSALGSLGKRGLRLQLPHTPSSKASPSNSGATIAERRAQMWQNVLTRQGAIVEDTHNGFAKVRSRRGGLTFEVGTLKKERMPSTLLEHDKDKPNDQRKETGEQRSDRQVNAKQSESESPAASVALNRLPETILLQAGRRPKPALNSTSEFGIGSAYHDRDLPEAPPSPIAMPGAWQGGSSWRSKPGDGYEEGALLLPPPLLDDHGSDASSFEGLLGVRRMREREKAKKQAEKLAARNRPTHKVGPFTALTNFVKAAHAAETSAKRMRGARRFGQPPVFARSYTEPQPTSHAQSGPPGSRRGVEVTALSAEEPVDTSKHKGSAMPTLRHADVAHAHDADVTLQLNHTVSPSLLATTAVDGEVRKSPNVTSASPFLSPVMRRAIMSRRSSRTGSLDAAGRQLNTVFESERLDPSRIPDDELASPDLPPISSPLLRPSSQGSTKASTFRDFPAAPRLLPVQLSMPPSPFTPLAINHRADGSESRVLPATTNGDYLSARVLYSAPRTPHLGPTTLSLPPSPWTPYQDSSAMHAQPMVHLHLNSSSSSFRMPPGTPRLVPSHIEILPSPFPTSASVSSRRGSLTYDSPQGLHAIGTARSPLTGAITDFTSFAALRLAQSSGTSSRPTAEEAADIKSAQAKNSIEKTQSNGALRLTPSSMLVAAQSVHFPSMVQKLESQSHDGVSTRPTIPRSNDHVASDHTPRRASMSEQRHASFHEAVHVDSSGRQRSFVLWFLIGDLGLRSRGAVGPSQSEDQLGGGEFDYGGIAAIFVHTFGLLVFVAAHLVDLAYSTYDKVSLVLWFLRWMVYNLTGRTVLAQCVVEAYSFIQAEWATVAIEDHEERGSKRNFNPKGYRKPKGLTRWQVLRGLLELYCLHSVTRERYLSEGAGLKRLEGWRKPSHRDQSHKASKAHGRDRVDIGIHRAASRAALDEKRRSWAQQDDKIEFSSTTDSTGPATGRTQPPATGGDGDRTNGNKLSGAVDDEEDDYDDEDEESSDDEMIVTNRGDDILEFAKTPRLDATRPGHSNTGYFGRAYDFMTSPQVVASQSNEIKRDLRPLKESTKDLVRTIKWCGRLAISAYGLHVHIVDLPPTFTPSGERFSRQTFAYLSRLNADDVLHADIQTLDADADYSPTFYVVRDYIRKVVCVAVRGTQSFSDIIVDLEMQTEEIELPQVQPTPGEEFRCHAGIWRAAKALVSPQSKLFATLRQALAENEGFGVMFCGHSLGGAIASAAVLLLAEYFIPDGAEPDSGTWVTNMSSGLPARRPIRAVSFASPVTMTADLASRAARGSVPLVTTVVLGSDIIPRVGHGQVRELRRVLGALSRVRRRHAMASSEGQDDARVHILRSYWDWRSICKTEDADDVMLHRKERIEEQLWSLRREVESDLYAAIKARLDAEGAASARIPPSPWVGPQQRDQAPLHKLAARRQELDMATLRSEAAQGGPLVPPGRCIWINEEQIYHVESPLAFFSLPELRSDMFAAHFPAAYEEAILELRT